MSAHFNLLRLLGRTLASSLGLCFCFLSPGFAGAVEIRSYGHSALLIKGGGRSVLLNPFQSVGCAAGLKEPRLRANVILASSELADEGARVAKGVFLVKPGSYRVAGINFEGFTAPHDRLGGRRFGQATLWQWSQAGMRFAHLGGSAAPLSGEDKILLGRPDVLIIAVGGGAKVYNGLEAAQVVRQLRPKFVIPVQYLRDTPSSKCDLQGVEPFLEEMKDIEVQKVGKIFKVSSNSLENTIIKLLH